MTGGELLGTLLVVYGLVGLACGTFIAYALTEPTARQPNFQDAAAVIGAFLAWPAWLVLVTVGMVLDALWDRRRSVYYGRQA